MRSYLKMKQAGVASVKSVPGEEIIITPAVTNGQGGQVVQAAVKVPGQPSIVLTRTVFDVVGNTTFVDETVSIQSLTNQKIRLEEAKAALELELLDLNAVIEDVVALST